MEHSSAERKKKLLPFGDSMDGLENIFNFLMIIEYSGS